MKTWIACFGFIGFWLGCSSTPQSEEKLEDAAKANCIQQCFNNSLPAIEQFACQKRCEEQDPYKL